MKYASMRSMDISNGEGVGVSLFTQGCHFHCKNCFNSDTWDFSGGKEWTRETEDKFMGLVNRPYIKRISLLGGEPLADENVLDVLHLVNRIKSECPDKMIWCYSGYTWEQIFPPVTPYLNLSQAEITRQNVVKSCDILVDGRFVEEEKDLSLEFRGSKNQRIIDVKERITSK